MTSKWSWMILALAGLPACALGGDAVALRGAKVYTTPDADPVINGVVVIRDGRIAAVGPKDDRPPTCGRQGFEL